MRKILGYALALAAVLLVCGCKENPIDDSGQSDSNQVAATKSGSLTIDPEKSYVQRFSGNIQSRFSIVSGTIAVGTSKSGGYYGDIYGYGTAYCNARRGFTWDGWFRGVWYCHLRTGRYFDMDENAPSVFGTVKVAEQRTYIQSYGISLMMQNLQTGFRDHGRARSDVQLI